MSKQVIVKKGKNWNAKMYADGFVAPQPGLESGWDTKPLQIYRTHVEHVIPHVSRWEAEGRNMKGVAYNKRNGQLVMPSVTVSGYITGISESSGVSLPTIPIDDSSGGPYLNWRFLAFGYTDMVSYCYKRGVPVPQNALKFEMESPWMRGEILSPPQSGIPKDIVRRSDIVLIRATNTHVLKYVREGGSNERDLFILQTLPKPIFREYLVAGDPAFEFAHPGLRMNDDTGCFKQAVYWRLNGGAWQRGAES